MSRQFFNEIEFGETDQLVTYGSGSPESSVSAPVGSIYLRSDGASGSAVYVKTSGTGNTGWEAVVDAGSTIDGSGGANRVAYWSDADTLTSNANFTFSSGNLSVPGDVIIDSHLLASTRLQSSATVSPKTLTFPDVTGNVVASTDTPSEVGYFLRSTSSGDAIGSWVALDPNDIPDLTLDFLVDVDAANATDGDILQYVGGSLNYWTTVPASSIGGGISGSGTEDEIAIWGPSDTLIGDSNLTYDGSVITLGGGDDFLATSTGSIVTLGRSSLDTGVQISGTGGSGSSNLWRSYTYKSFNSTSRSILQFYASRGSGPGSESTITSGDYLGSLEWYGVNTGSTFTNTAEIRVTASENWSGSAAGSRMGFFTLNDSVAASPSERLRISTEGIRSFVDVYANADVFLPNISNTETSYVVYFNDSTGEITYGDAPSGGGAVELNELLDVSVGDATDDDVLAYVGGSVGGWFPFDGYITKTPDTSTRNRITPVGSTTALDIRMPSGNTANPLIITEGSSSLFAVTDDGYAVTYGGFIINQTSGATRLSWAGNVLGATYSYIESTQPSFNRTAGYILLSAGSADAGYLDVSGSTAAGGHLDLSGGSASGASAGSIDLSGGSAASAAGGSITSTGDSSGGSGASIIGSASSGFSGGAIITSAGTGGAGGVIATSGGTSGAGGTILTNDGGGNIITNSSVSSYIGFGPSGNRITLRTLNPASDHTQTLPETSGYVLVDPDSTTVAGRAAFSTAVEGVIEMRDIEFGDISGINVDGSFVPNDGDYLQYFGGSIDEWRSTPTLEFERIVVDEVSVPTNTNFHPIVGIDEDGRLIRSQNTASADSVAYIFSTGGLGVQSDNSLGAITLTGYGGSFDELGGGAIVWQRGYGSAASPSTVSKGPFFIFTDGRGTAQGSSLGFFQAQGYNGTTWANAAWLGAFVDQESPNPIGSATNQMPGRWVFMTSAGDGTEPFPSPALIVKSNKNVEISRGNLQLFSGNGIELWDSANAGHILIRPPTSVTGDGSESQLILTLPNTGGQPDQALLTDGTGVLRWGDVSSSGEGTGHFSVSVDLDDDGVSFNTTGTDRSNIFDSDNWTAYSSTTHSSSDVTYTASTGIFTVEKDGIFAMSVVLSMTSNQTGSVFAVEIDINGTTENSINHMVYSTVLSPMVANVEIIKELTEGDEIEFYIHLQSPTSTNVTGTVLAGTTANIHEVAAGGSAATALNDLTDVNVPNPSDGECLCYVGGSINEWQAMEVGADAYVGIWAEESATISTGTNSGFQWSFGNGDTPGAGDGIHIPVDCDLVLLGISSETSGTATVSLSVNGSEPAGADVSTTAQSNNFVTFADGEQSFSAGDIINFRTTAYTSGHTGGSRVVAWFKTSAGASGGGGGTPGGSDTQVQYNDSGSFGGDADFTWNDSTNTLTVAGTIDATTVDATTLVSPGSDTEILVNTGGNIGSEAAFTYNDATNTMQIATGFVVLSGDSGLSVGETTTTAGGLRFKRNSASAAFIRMNNDNGTEFGGQMRTLGTAQGFAWTDLAASSEWMRITSNPFLGIGTNDPLVSIHAYDNGTTTSRLIFETTSTSNQPGFQVQWDHSATRRALMRGLAATNSTINSPGGATATEWQWYTRDSSGTLNQNMILDQDGHLNINLANEVRLWNATGWSGGNYIGFSASGATGTQTYILPTAVGSSGQYLELDNSGTGQLVWSTPSGSGVSFGSNDQIPHMNVGGSDFDYSANLTFNGTALQTNIIRTGNGSVSAPGHSFTSDTNSGLYLIADDNFAISAGGVAMMEFTEAGTDFIESFVQHRFSDGSLAAPGISFVSDTDCGIYRITTDNIAIVAGGVNMMEFTESTTDIIQSLVTHELTDGSLSTLALRFSSDTNNGMYYRSTDEWALVAGGVEMIILDESSPDNVVIPVSLVFGSTTNYTGFTQAFTGTPDGTIWALPSSDGSEGQVMKTDGFGELFWDNPIGAGTSFPSTPDDGLYYHRTDDDWLYHNDDGRGRWLGELETYTFSFSGTTTSDTYLYCNNVQHSSSFTNGIYTPYDFTVVGMTFTNANSVSGTIEVESAFNGTIASLSLSSDSIAEDMTLNGFAGTDVWKVFIDYTSGTFEDVTVTVYIRRDRGSSSGGIA
tara:strand:+ start:276556 stop:282912 length:6357 start_codon:yes stop_codon:yes gene_type:complete